MDPSVQNFLSNSPIEQWTPLIPNHLWDIAWFTDNAVENKQDPVAIKAIEFWSWIWKISLDSGESQHPCFLFLKQHLQLFVVLFLKMLCRQIEDQDRVNWMLVLAGEECLVLVARLVGDEIFPFVKPFIRENLNNVDWRYREASRNALRCLFRGVSVATLTPVIRGFLEALYIDLISDSNLHVKSVSAWVISDIFELFPASVINITPLMCKKLVNALGKAFKDSPNVAERSCKAIYFIIRRYEEEGSSPVTSSSFFSMAIESVVKDTTISSLWQKIVKALVKATERNDGSGSHLRTAAFQALKEVVRCSPQEAITDMKVLYGAIFQKLNDLVKDNNNVTPDRENHVELLWSCVGLILKKLKSCEPLLIMLDQNVEEMVQLFLCADTAHEEAMLAIGSLINVAESNFSKYLERSHAFNVRLVECFQNFNDYRLCAATVIVFSDICKSVKSLNENDYELIIGLLIDGLTRKELHQSVKPHIFSCLGEIASNIGSKFEPHLLQVLRKLRIEVDELLVDEKFEHINVLKTGILKGCLGLAQGIKTNSSSLNRLVYQIFKVLDKIYAQKEMDDRVKKAAQDVVNYLVTLGTEERLSKEDHFETWKLSIKAARR